MYKNISYHGSGISQVKSHAKCHKEDSKQLKFGIKKQTSVLRKKLELTSENQVVRIIQALLSAENNYSFSSAASYSSRFQIFADS